MTRGGGGGASACESAARLCMLVSFTRRPPAQAVRQGNTKQGREGRGGERDEAGRRAGGRARREGGKEGGRGRRGGMKQQPEGGGTGDLAAQSEGEGLAASLEVYHLALGCAAAETEKS